MKATQKQKRTSILHLALVLSLAFVGSVFLEVVRPSNASAATFSEMSIEDKAQVWVMGRAVSECINNRGFETQNQSGSDINDGKWMWTKYGADGSTNIGEWAADITEGESDDSRANCREAAKKTLELMGVSGTDAVCKMNELAGKKIWERDNGDDCEHGAGDYDFNEDDFDKKDTDIWNNFFRDWLGGNVEASLSQGMRYVIYSENFYQECSHDHGDDWNDPREWASGDSESDKVYKLKGLLQLGATADKDWYVVSGGNGRDHDVHIDGYGMLTSDDKLQCATLAERINGNASGYLEELAKSTNPDDPQDGGDGSTDPAGNETTCAVDGVGWIVCPIMTFIAKLNDSAFDFLTSMLAIRPALITDSSTQKAWAAFRDIANVAFAIAFMVIVYSQLTSAGISNYGIKRMLPRLFVAAVLVNVSFWICAAAVDISNIVGSSIYSLLGTSINVGGSGTAGGAGETWTSIIAGVLIAAAGVLLVVAVVLAPTVLLALAVILLILVARQAFVIILIVLSPLAFVAYLLPNTEDWFKRWWKMLSATLMVFPIIGIVFGASTLASRILMNVAQSGSDDDQMLKLVAMAVLAVPLFAVPSLLIGSLSAAGSIGAKVGNLSNRLNKGAASKGKARFDQSALGQYRGYRRTERDKRRALTQAGVYEGRNPLRKAASKAQGAFYGSERSGAFGDRIIASGTALADKEWDDEVKRQKTSMTGKNHQELMAIMRDSTATAEKRAAAAGTIMSRDYRAGHLEALQAAGQLGRSNDKDIGGIQKQMAYDMKDKPFALGDQAAGQLGIGTYGKPQPAGPDGKVPEQLGDLNSEFKDRLGKKLSASGLASMNPDELKLAHKMATGGELDSAQLGNLQRSIAAARSDDRLKVLIKPEAEKLHNEILSQVSEATLDEAHQMNIQHDQETAAVQNALNGMEGNNPSEPRQP